MKLFYKEQMHEDISEHTHTKYYDKIYNALSVEDGKLKSSSDEVSIMTATEISGLPSHLTGGSARLGFAKLEYETADGYVVAVVDNDYDKLIISLYYFLLL